MGEVKRVDESSRLEVGVRDVLRIFRRRRKRARRDRPKVVCSANGLSMTRLALAILETFLARESELTFEPALLVQNVLGLGDISSRPLDRL